MIFFVCGITCSGKSTLIDEAKKYPTEFGTVEVGRVLRARYSPKHFAGQGAPEHTQEEALNIYREQLLAHQDKDAILVDGQPRNINQVRDVYSIAFDQKRGRPHMLMLYCSTGVRLQRAEQRFHADASGLALALKRMDRDAQDLYHVLGLVSLEVGPVPISWIDTEKMTPEQVLTFIRHHTIRMKR